jgi:hypothetical protein
VGVEAGVDSFALEVPAGVVAVEEERESVL